MDSEKKYNVLVVHNYYQIPGGEDTVVSNEIKMLKEHGHNVIFYSRNNSELKEMSIFQKLLLPLNTVFNVKTYKEICKIIRDNNINIVHVHNTLNLISQSVYYAAVHCNVTVVQTVHNFRMLCPAATFYRDGHICEDCTKKGLLCAVKHKCYRNSRIETLICAISTKIHRLTGIYGKINYIHLTEFNKEKFLMLNNEKKIIDSNKLFVKPNFTFEQSANETVENKNFYLFAGRLEDIKGLKIIIDAFNKMPSKKLLIAGTGSQIDQYKKLSNDNITFLGLCDKEKLSYLLSNAKAMITASQLYETFGMVVVEAFAAKCPVISGNLGNMGDLVDEHINGLKFRYNDSDDLIKKINEFEKSDDKMLKENAYNKFLNNFSEQSNYKMLMQIYDNIS